MVVGILAHGHPLVSSFHTGLACEVEYSKLVRKKGFYVGLADVTLMAWSVGRNVTFLIYDEEAIPEYFSGLQVMLQAVDRRALEASQVCPPDDAETWRLVFFRADFTKAHIERLNHFAPLWTREQVGDEEYFHQSDAVAGDAANKVLELEMEMQECCIQNMKELLQYDDGSLTILSSIYIYIYILNLHKFAGPPVYPPLQFHFALV